MAKKVEKGDLVYYRDRSGIEGNWKVQAVNDAGKLQLKHTGQPKIALGVDPSEVADAVVEVAEQVGAIAKLAEKAVVDGRIGWLMAGLAAGVALVGAIAALWMFN